MNVRVCVHLGGCAQGFSPLGMTCATASYSCHLRNFVMASRGFGALSPLGSRIAPSMRPIPLPISCHSTPQLLVRVLCLYLCGPGKRTGHKLYD